MKIYQLWEKIQIRDFSTTIKDWFSGIGQWVAGIFEGNKDLGILGNTNDNLLGDDAAQIDATDKDAINLTIK